MKAFAPSDRETKGAFPLLDRDLQANRAPLVRFNSDSAGQALLVSLSVLRSKSKEFVAEVKTAERPLEDASVLFVSSPGAASELKSLLPTVERIPDWIAVPDPQAGSFELPGTVEQATGRVRSRSDAEKHLSFTLYLYKSDLYKPGAIKQARLQPAKAKIPEPEQNLLNRAQWFKKRRKIR